MVEVVINKETKTVSEVDVLRGAEMIKRYAGKAGSICFVVRRPG
jgi:hypothetical protein